MREYIQYTVGKEHVCRWQEWSLGNHQYKIIIWVDDKDPVEVILEDAADSFERSRFVNKYLNDPDTTLAMHYL